ncbi:unnamed protein product [Ectocarpus sp. 6 AP-2014]
MDYCTSDPRAARRQPCTRRDVDGVDSDLREKISERLPTIEDQEQAAAAAAAASAVTTEEAESAPAGGARAGAARVTLNPATLARALPHIRRLMARGSGEGGDGHAASVGGLLGLLQGGGLVFPDARGAASAGMKHGEEKRAYQERRDRLLLLREQKEYQRMIDNIQRAPRETVRDIQASFKFQVGMGANMVVAVFTTFIISYWASKFIVGDNKSHRLVIGLVGAMFIMLVELLVFVTRSLKADEVLEDARRDAEESHTAVGVHRLAPRPGDPMEPMGGRGMLEQNRTNSSRRGREYELVHTRGEDELSEDKRGGVSEPVGIRRVVEG